jgi:hypothetical protein
MEQNQEDREGEYDHGQITWTEQWVGILVSEAID